MFGATAHEVIRQEISLIVLPAFFVRILAADRSAGGETPGLVRFYIIGKACGLGTDVTGRINFFRIAYIHYLATFVKVVYIGIDTEHLPVIKAHQKCLTAPKFSSACIGGKFCHPCSDVFPFEMHIHHITLVVHVLSGKFRLLAGFVVNLDAAHDIGGQVVECGLDVSLKEILAADEQVVHPFAVDAYLAVCHFCSRQLLNKFTERFGLRHVEGICVVNECIAFIVHFDACRFHDHFIELLFLGLGDKIDCWHLNHSASGIRLNLTIILLKAIGLYEEHKGFSCRSDKGKRSTAVFVYIVVLPVAALFGHYAITCGIRCQNSRTVGGHQADCGAVYTFQCHGIDNVAVDSDFLGRNGIEKSYK